MGFEIDSEEVKINEDGTVPTSSRKIGTVTFIDKNTNQFAALGHATIKENKNNSVKGLCYDIKFEGINKATKEETGNVIASIDRTNHIGYIYKDSRYGVFGTVEEINETYEEVETACFYNVKKGKANIIMAFDEKEPKSYEVEVIGIDYINQNKNIKIKVLDEELIKKTGGIVQGMSGAPLLQERKANRCSKLCLYRRPRNCICNIYR